MTPRELVKRIALGLAHIAILPTLLLHALKVPILGKDRALEGSTQFLALFPGLCGDYLRRAFLHWTIAECAGSASIGFGTIFSKSAAWLGPNVYVGPYCSLGSVTVEREVLIATGTHILSGGHIHGTDPDLPIREQEGTIAHVTIGAGSWIGAGSVIMANVGRDSIVAAGAVVVHAIPDRVVAAGVPAKVLRSRDE